MWLFPTDVLQRTPATGRRMRLVVRCRREPWVLVMPPDHGLCVSPIAAPAEPVEGGTLTVDRRVFRALAQSAEQQRREAWRRRVLAGLRRVSRHPIADELRAELLAMQREPRLPLP